MSKETIAPIADRVIKKCGGHQAAADLAGVGLSRTYYWTYPKAKRGTGGHIPLRAQQSLLKAAKAGLVDLTPADFHEGWQ